MAVAAGDAAIAVVDTEFRSLISADHSTAVCGPRFSVKMPACALTASTFHIPAAARIWHNMMRLRSFSHFNLLELPIRHVPLLRTIWLIAIRLSRR